MSNSGKGPQRRRSIWPVVIGLPLIVVVAAAAIYLSAAQSNNGAASSGGAGQARPAKPSASKQQAGRTSGQASSSGALGAPELGRADAPVVMQEFGDFQ